MGLGRVLLVAVAAVAAALVYGGFSKGESSQSRFDIISLLGLRIDDVAKTQGDYDDTYAGERDETMVDDYYTLVTDFYEYGWGQSFHFAHTKTSESHDASILRHEYRLADVLGLEAGKNVIDIGCGIGGPARNIAEHSGANVTGVTINDYQIKRARELTTARGLDEIAHFEQGDFTDLKYAQSTFDGAYAIESTCHARKLEDVYGEAFRVLKPGGKFAIYEWIKTAEFSVDSTEHVEILAEIEYGNGLPPLRGLDEVKAAAAAVGFKWITDMDLAQDLDETVSWYAKLEMDKWQIMFTHFTCMVTQFFGLAPAGTVKTHGILTTAARGLVAGGQANVFTPMHFVLLQKPLLMN